MRKKGLFFKKGAHLLAVTALTVSLLGSQIQPVFAENPVKIEENRMILEEMYIEAGFPLSSLELPKHDHGKFTWENEDYVPDAEEVRCTILFTPNKDADISVWKKLEGWDAEAGVLKTTVTISVENFSEMEETVVEEPVVEEIVEESVQETPVVEETTEEPVEETPVADDTVEEPVQEENAADEVVEEIQEEQIVEELVSEEEVTLAEPAEDPSAEAEETAESDVEVTDETSETETSEDTDASNETESAEQEAENTEGNEAEENQTEDTENKEDTEAADQETESEEESDKAETEETPEDTNTENSDVEAPVTDIFNRDLTSSESDNREVVIDVNASEEEKARIAAINHTSNGIIVTGPNLPWYVQFRAYQVEQASFSTRSTANIFQCFDFELWDLLNDTKYVIPDGDYVSVIIPVIEGYDYTVEHVLDNGAVETIIPTVTGSTLVFSTHSFSSFGIAGSRPIVGGDVAQGGYQDPTPTPTAKPTATPKPEATAKPTATPKPEATAKPTATPKPQATTKPTAKPTEKPATSATPGVTKPTVTPGASVGGQTVIVGQVGNNDKNNNNSANTNTNNTGSQQSSQNKQETVTNQPSNNAVQNPNGNATVKLPVETGDTTMIIPFVILVSVAGVAILLVIVLKRKRK